jgi:hypothetical protein
MPALQLQRPDDFAAHQGLEFRRIMNDIRNHPITMMRAEQPEGLDDTTRKVALKCKHAFLPGKPERCCHCGISKDDWETLQAAQYSPAVWGGFGALQPPNDADFDAWMRAHGYRQEKDGSWSSDGSQCVLSGDTLIVVPAEDLDYWTGPPRRMDEALYDAMIYGYGATKVDFYDNSRASDSTMLTEATIQKTVDQIRAACTNKNVKLSAARYLTPAHTWHLPDFSTAKMTAKIHEKWDEPSSDPASDGDKVGDQPK